MISVGFDTSNYTTSIAAFDGKQLINCSKILEVRPGELGLRQSDALFAHIKNLPELADNLFQQFENEQISCVGVSSRPRAIEGSYMPCFLAGVTSAKVLSAANHTKCLYFSHQQGHIAAVVYSSGREDLWNHEFLAWHLSGGTTELLYVKPNGFAFDCQIIGGTNDISAGQLIDRTGRLLGLQFPSGKYVDSLYKSDFNDRFKVKVNDLRFSLSGIENKMQRIQDDYESSERTASYVLDTICNTILTVTEKAINQYHDLPVVFTGGVSSNSVLRKKANASKIDCVFGEPKFSTDNAAGIAVLTYRNGV